MARYTVLHHDPAPESDPPIVVEVKRNELGQPSVYLNGHMICSLAYEGIMRLHVITDDLVNEGIQRDGKTNYIRLEE